MLRKRSGRVESSYRSDGNIGPKSEILWRRESEDFDVGDDFAFDVSAKVLESDETLSSSSWGFNDYEIKSVKKIASSLEAIDEALFEGNFSSLNEQLHSECQKWRDAFPHLRVTGKQISLQPNKQQEDSQKLENLKQTFSNHFGLEQRTTYLEEKEQLTYRDLSVPGAGDGFIEEVIEQDGLCEGPAASDERCISNGFCKRSSLKSDSGAPFSYNYVKEKVIDQLATLVWESVVSKFSKKSESYGANVSDHLPPITAAHEQDLPPVQKFKVRGWNTLASDFPRLDGILMVSPKVLLPKHERTVTKETSSRPSTGWSSASCASSSSSSASAQISGSNKYCRNAGRCKQRSSVDGCSSKIAEKDLDLIQMYLPVVENQELGPTSRLVEAVTEGSHILSNGLQGMHIEPEVRKLSRFISLDGAGSGARPSGFLPPIEDRGSSAAYKTRQRPALCEPQCRKRSQNMCTIYARHLNRTGSRPSTSQTNDMNISEHTRMKNIGGQSPSKSGDNLIGKQKLSSSPSACNNNNLVNLLPIVTSLEPKQLMKRKQTGQKKSILTAFPQKEKR